ncbi:hypothetical protein NG798_06150 [Ancylothrix sp. C2]|nr:hypothetical protein [Ancylothrix sp. D3o]
MTITISGAGCVVGVSLFRGSFWGEFRIEELVVVGLCRRSVWQPVKNKI